MGPYLTYPQPHVHQENPNILVYKDTFWDVRTGEFLGKGCSCGKFIAVIEEKRVDLLSSKTLEPVAEVSLTSLSPDWNSAGTHWVGGGNFSSPFLAGSRLSARSTHLSLPFSVVLWSKELGWVEPEGGEPLKIGVLTCRGTKVTWSQLAPPMPLLVWDSVTGRFEGELFWLSEDGDVVVCFDRDSCVLTNGKHTSERLSLREPSNYGSWAIPGNHWFAGKDEEKWDVWDARRLRMVATYPLSARFALDGPRLFCLVGAQLEILELDGEGLVAKKKLRVPQDARIEAAGDFTLCSVETETREEKHFYLLRPNTDEWLRVSGTYLRETRGYLNKDVLVLASPGASVSRFSLPDLRELPELRLDHR